MTVELITGFADTPHVDAADDGALNAAIISDHNHVLGTPSPAVMRDSNHLTVPTMEALFQGRHVRVTSAEDVTIASGSQGLKRHDIVGFRYNRDSSTNVETVVLDVIRGTASSTAKDPALPTGNILNGASSAFMPLYMVPLEGIKVWDPHTLFNVLRPMSELWDSVNQASSTTFTWGYGSSFTLIRYGHVVTCSGQSALKSEMGKATNTLFRSVIPGGYRPAKGGAIFARAINNQYFTFNINSNGEMRISTTSGMVEGYMFDYVGAWITA